MTNLRKPTPVEVGQLQGRLAKYFVDLDKSRLIDVTADNASFTFHEGPTDIHAFGKVYAEDIVAEVLQVTCDPTETGDPALSLANGITYDPLTDEICWRQNGNLHNESGPAVINLRHQYMSWYQNGIEHNSFGPSRVQLKERRTVHSFLGARYAGTGRIAGGVLRDWKRQQLKQTQAMIASKANAGELNTGANKNLADLTAAAADELAMIEVAEQLRSGRTNVDPAAKKQLLTKVVTELNRLAKQEIGYLNKEIQAKGGEVTADKLTSPVFDANMFDALMEEDINIDPVPAAKTPYDPSTFSAALKETIDKIEHEEQEKLADVKSKLEVADTNTKPKAVLPKQAQAQPAVGSPAYQQALKTAAQAALLKKAAAAATVFNGDALKMYNAMSQTKQPTETQEEAPAMTDTKAQETPSITARVKKTLKADGKLALYRIAANQTVQAVQLAVVAFMTKDIRTKRDKEKMSSLILTAFKSEEGAMFLAMMLGVALPYIAETLPAEAQAVAIQMAQEFRVKAMADAGTKISNAGIMVAYEQLSGQLGSILAPVVASLEEGEEETPAPSTKLRVEAGAAPAPEHAEAATARPAKAQRNAH